jgi:excisionase family DNA binding protein
MPMIEKLLFSKDEAAEILGVSLGRLNQSIYSGEIPIKRIGRRVLIPRSSLEAFSRIDESESVGAKQCQ